MRGVVALLFGAVLLGGCLAPPGEDRPDAFLFLGAHALAGVMNLPYVPLEVRNDTLHALREYRPAGTDGARFDVVAATRYCREEFPPFALRSDDLRYAGHPEPTWYAGKVGQPVRPGDFAPNASAYATWGEDDGGRLLIVLRLAGPRVGPFDAEFAAFSALDPWRCIVPKGEWGDAARPLPPGVVGPILLADLGDASWDPRRIERDVGHPAPRSLVGG